MKLKQTAELIKAEFLCCGDTEAEITYCMAADMMSDVLAFAEPGALLITGLTNSKSVRTADIADCCGIVYIRGKKPDEKTIALAIELEIPLLSTETNMFKACGILFGTGIRGVC